MDAFKGMCLGSGFCQTPLLAKTFDSSVAVQGVQYKQIGPSTLHYYLPHPILCCIIVLATKVRDGFVGMSHGIVYLNGSADDMFGGWITRSA